MGTKERQQIMNQPTVPPPLPSTPQIPASTKQCKKCRSVIDKRATKCPHCRSTQGFFRKTGKVLGITFLIFVGINILGQLAKNAKDPTTQPASDAEPTTVVEEDKTADLIIRELSSHRKGSRKWRNILVKADITREELIELAQEMHKRDSQTSFNFFNDDSQFKNYLQWEKYYPNKYYPFPEEWLKKHNLGMLNRMGPVSDNRWELLSWDGAFVLAVID